MTSSTDTTPEGIGKPTEVGSPDWWLTAEVTTGNALRWYEISDEDRNALQALAAERDEALDRVDELEREAEIVSVEFEKDCWVAVRKLLGCVGYDVADADYGVTAQDACDIIWEAIRDGQSALAAEVAKREAAEGEARAYANVVDQLNERLRDMDEFPDAVDHWRAEADRLEAENARLKARERKLEEECLDDLSMAFVAGAMAVHIELRPDDHSDPKFGEAAQDWAHNFVYRLCEDCPPVDYPTDKTRCLRCPRRAASLIQREGE